MARGVVTPRARSDVDDIWLNVTLDSPAASDRLIDLIDLIVARCQNLRDYPRLGPARPEIAPEARMLVVGDCIVLYRMDGANVAIVRVVHGARQLKDLFGDWADE